ncbi:MAG TPA: DUF6036 family nucleotidyltransferase [Tepidisphaeraceae bacterium]
MLSAWLACRRFVHGDAVCRMTIISSIGKESPGPAAAFGPWSRDMIDPAMSVVPRDLWSLTFGQPQIDPADLALAIEAEAACEALDFRTRLLIRDGLNALERRWGGERCREWLSHSPRSARLQAIWQEDLGPAGFQTLGQRLMEKTQTETIRQLFRELGTLVSRPTRIDIGGSGALILLGYLSRSTDDVDVVGEVPYELRAQHGAMEQLASRYGLRFAHFQSYYLPTGWNDRVKSLGRFGNLVVCQVDPLDIFVGKLFSDREKDLDDLRLLAPQLGKAEITDRLRKVGQSLMSEEKLAGYARKNWYILFGEELPA